MEDLAVNTANNSDPPPQKKPRGRPFVKGDARINRKGRPIRDVDLLAKEWQDTFAEFVFDADGKPIIDEVTGKPLTRLKARMRVATTSRDIREFQLALAYSYGKPKEQLDVTSKGERLKTVEVVEIIKTYEPKESSE